MFATVDRLAALMPEAAEALASLRESLREARLRAGWPVRLLSGAQTIEAGPALTTERLSHILAALLDHSVHAREEELRRAVFLSAGRLPRGCVRPGGR